MRPKLHQGVRDHLRAIVVVGLLMLTVCIVGFAEYEYDGTCTVPYDTVTLDNHVIRFCGRTYDAGSDQSTWYYSVTSGASPAVSHWILSLCVEHTVVDAGPGSIELGYDPTTELTGIKWDEGMTGGETRTFWVTLAGNWEAEEVTVGIKAGKNEPIGTILGPSCTPYTPPVLEVTVSGLTDLDITQALIGAWSGNPAEERQSLGDLTVSVVATVPYDVYVYYTVVPVPLPSFAGDPLLFEYPTGTWTTIPAWPTMVPLLGLSGTQVRSYPVVVDIQDLGNRSAGESYTFTVHVLVSE